MKSYIKQILFIAIMIVGTSLIASAQSKPPPKPKPPVIKPKPKPKPKPQTVGLVNINFRAIVE